MSKITIVLHDPFGVDDAVDEYLNEIQPPGLTGDAEESWREKRGDEILGKIARWVDFGEHVELEIDLDEMTCVVKEKVR